MPTIPYVPTYRRGTTAPLAYVDTQANFGAVGDGIVDDTNAIIAAIQYVEARGGGIVFFPKGTYLVSAEIATTSDNVMLCGVGPEASIIKTTSATANVFVFDGGTYCFASDLGFTSSVTRTAGYNILFDGCYKSGVSRIYSLGQFRTVGFIDSVLVQADDCYFENPTAATGSGVYIDGGNDQILEDVRMNGAQNIATGTLTSGNATITGISASDILKFSAGQQIFGPGITYGTTVDSVGATSVVMSANANATGSSANIFMGSTQPYAAIHVVKTGALALYDCGSVYGGNGLALVPKTSSEIANVFSLACTWDTGSGHGILLQAASGTTIKSAYFVQDWASSNAQNGVVTAGAGTIADLSFVGCRILNNGQHGIIFDDVATDVSVVDSAVRANSAESTGVYSGIRHDATAGCRIIGNRSGPLSPYTQLQKYGIEINSTTDHYVITSNDVRGNGTAGILDAASGTDKTIHDNLGGSSSYSTVAETINLTAATPAAGAALGAAQYLVGGHLQIDTYAAASAAQLGRANGSISSPTQVLANQVLAGFTYRGYGATGFSTARGALQVQTTQDWTDSAQGMRVLGNAVADGSTTSVEAIRWDSNGVAIKNGFAIPAGGTAGVGLRFSATANFGVFFGSGAPSLAAAKGSLYLRSDGSTTNDRMYVNTDGSTTWTAVTTAA